MKFHHLPASDEQRKLATHQSKCPPSDGNPAAPAFLTSDDRFDTRSIDRSLAS